jgi:transposase-like protein
MGSRHIPDATAREIVAVYRDTNDSVAEIAKAYGVGVNTVYRCLRRAGVLPGDRSTPQATAPSAARPAEPATPPNGTAGLRVTTDREGFVQQAERVGTAQTFWEVRYEGVLKIPAETIEDAISKAKHAPGVRTVVSAGRVNGHKP